uniref:Uncharacterized protein n=1 Tax=Candidatus Kentrum sp. TUN TaxID=2126343 RepID=A0A450ZJP5_9GAMM|nr:MAG: hypothetical protein BECKTUN1418F_GA0071002_103516 [Candidatus Kentron sp. TUN]VFK56035.1 MAG: hypothetical protein BECKTUN1418E_GA0071001_103616 [Candidatus Kentron sp. TUN]VFK56673.1 MAG: hypothetical protein BECKTUN1418D_GA0071000_10513 [Candidatus Kentron sp. TUN]
MISHRLLLGSNFPAILQGFFQLPERNGMRIFHEIRWYDTRLFQSHRGLPMVTGEVKTCS